MSTNHGHWLRQFHREGTGWYSLRNAMARPDLRFWCGLVVRLWWKRAA